MEEIKITNIAGAFSKKPYSKPTIHKVKLAANETVLATCKYAESQAGRALCQPDVTCVVTWRS